MARQSSKKSSARARNRFRDANRLRQEEGVDARRINEAAERIRGRYPASIAGKIITRKIWIGMTREMATDSWGQPDDVNRTVSEDIVRERWVYETEQTSLYFVDGVLDAWEKETGHSAIETQEGSDSGSDRP